MKVVKPNPDLLRLGSRIKAARFVAGMSQDRLAESAGMDRSYISRLELGKANPTYITLIKISDSLGIEILELVRREGERH